MTAAADDIFEPVTGKVSLENLTKTIKDDVPRAACIHNMILMHAKGYADIFDIYVQKNSPDSILLVEKHDAGIVSVYCPQPNEDEFLDALAKTELIIWDIFNCALYVPDTICEKLSTLIIERTAAEVFIKEGEFHIYDPEEDTMELEIPAGFTLRKLGHASAIQMEAVGEPLFVCPNLNKFRELHITAPNCTVYHTEGEPKKRINFDQNDLPEAVEEGISLAWACSNKEGQLGVVCTDEAEILKIVESKEDLDQMEKLLTHLVVNACTLRMVKEGFIVHSNIYHGLSEVPHMSNWRHVGYICSIYSRFTDSSTDDDRLTPDDERVGTIDDFVAADEGYLGRPVNYSVEGAHEEMHEGADDEELGEADDEELGGADDEELEENSDEELEENSDEELGGADDEEQGGADDTELSGTDDEKLDGTEDEDLGGMDDEEQGGMDDEEQGGMDHEDLGGTDDEVLAGTDDEELAGTDDEELAGTDDEELAGTDDEELAGTDDEELAGTDDEELAGTDDEELAGTNDEELAGTDDEELGGTDVEVGDTDVELVGTESDLKGATQTDDANAD